MKFTLHGQEYDSAKMPAPIAPAAALPAGEDTRPAEKPAADRFRMAATGYGAHGASTVKNYALGWLYGGGSAEDDIDLQGDKLRKRARDLYTGGGLGRGAPATLTTNVVGWGIRPRPKIDAAALGLSEDAAAEWQKKAQREFELWAKTPMCDACRQHNFWELQELAFRSMLMSGDVFALFTEKANPRTPYQLALRLIEADRVSTPDTDGESAAEQTDSGGRIIDGVEVNSEGEVIRYHISNYHPLMEDMPDSLAWTAIDAFGKDTGMPNILHLMTAERPDQHRGVPYIAAMIEQIKSLDRYIDSELAANIVSAMLTVFLTSQTDDGTFSLDDAVPEADKVTDEERQLELASGAIYKLNPGENVTTVNPGRTNTTFDSFVGRMVTMIGSSVEIPPEVLLHAYNSNYTAAKAALLDFWRVVRRYRTRFTDSFNQPVYEQWLAEAVALGRIEAPGFFDDAGIRDAWCGCQWIGASQGHVNPVQEAEAAAQRVALNISTEETEALEFNGSDWAENIRQRAKEIAARREIGADPDPDTGGAGGSNGSWGRDESRRNGSDD